MLCFLQIYVKTSFHQNPLKITKNNSKGIFSLKKINAVRNAETHFLEFFCCKNEENKFCDFSE